MEAFDHDLIRIIASDIFGYIESCVGPWDKQGTLASHARYGLTFRETCKVDDEMSIEGF